MTSLFPSDPFTQLGFEPIRMECDYSSVPVSGDLPSDLNGTLYRIGPNPQFAPRGRYNPLQGDGMIHAFYFAGGKVAYRNRWVRTRQWMLDQAAGRALFATSGNPADNDPSVAGIATDGVANTHLVWHGGKLLALEEAHAPIQIDPVSLDTVGPWTFDGRLPGNMTAHPKLDPETGEMICFANIPRKKLSGEIAYYTVDATGRMVGNGMIQGPFAALVHDFAVTRNFVIFFVCPVTVSVKRALAGISPIAWEPEHQIHVGVVPRNGSGDEIRWFTGDAAMVWHSVNAFDDADHIVIDVCQQAAPAFPRVDGTIADDNLLRQYLTRWTLDWSGPPGLTIHRLSDVVCEYPRIDERRAGLTYRHLFVACDGGPGTGDLFHRAVGHFDHVTGRMRIFHAGTRCSVGEPVFVPKAAASAEGDGYVLTMVFDEPGNRSHLAIFDAQHIERGPVARVHLDHRVPAGFHGMWRGT